jgi:hypothetical protein
MSLFFEAEFAKIVDQILPYLALFNNMIYSLIEKNVRILILLTIGIISIVFYLLKDPVNSVSVQDGEVTVTQYGIGMLNDSKEYFLLGSALNDYYYQGKVQMHLSDKAEIGNQDLLTKFVNDVKDILLNQKTLSLSYALKNKDMVGKVSYYVRSNGNKIEVEREVVMNQDFDQIGQSIIVCQGCFVVDNRKRLYVNKKILGQDAVDFAEKMKLTPIVIGENDVFPAGATQINILNKKGKVKIRIPVRDGERIALQETWNLLEFRIPVESAGRARLKQVIYL